MQEDVKDSTGPLRISTVRAKLSLFSRKKSSSRGTHTQFAANPSLFKRSRDQKAEIHLITKTERVLEIISRRLIEFGISLAVNRTKLQVILRAYFGAESNLHSYPGYGRQAPSNKFGMMKRRKNAMNA